MTICSKCKKPITNGVGNICANCGRAYCDKCSDSSFFICNGCNGSVKPLS